MNPSSNQFGLMVAYLLPGFIALAGLAPLAPVVATWLAPLNQTEASIGPPIYAVLAATTLGMIVSCFRWLLIDHLFILTGLRPPTWDDRMLEQRLAAFDFLVQNHYRYFQFTSNATISIVFAYCVNRYLDTSALMGITTDIAVLLICAALLWGSHDALTKYYTRTLRLIGELEQKGSFAMTNGNDHDSNGATSATPPADAKPQAKTATSAKARPKSNPRKSTR